VNGLVIMYADKESDAMRLAIGETERRRRIQTEYNERHGITPMTIKKAVQDILVRKKDAAKKNEELSIDVLKAGYNILIPKERNALVKDLEAIMFEHAKNLEFEQAALVRDEIERIKRLEG